SSSPRTRADAPPSRSCCPCPRVADPAPRGQDRAQTARFPEPARPIRDDYDRPNRRRPTTMRLAALPLPLLLAALPAQTRFAELGVRDHLPLERFEVVDLASGDLDGDRAPDVAILAPGRVRLLRNDGHAVFTRLGAFDIAPRGRFGAIALFDLEADGDRDVLFVLMDAASGILRNDPGGFVQIASPVTGPVRELAVDRKSTRLNSSHVKISYAVFCLKKKSSR